MDVEVALALLSVATKYGIPMVQKTMQDWKTDKPLTIDDIEKLELKFKDPSTYFKK